MWFRKSRDFLQERIDYAQSLGIPCENIIIDPGIGFGKGHIHNLLLQASGSPG
jgi:dihydropteroate synthase